MPETQLPVRVIRFGDFEADLRTGELRKDGVRLKFSGQPFQVLAILLERGHASRMAGTGTISPAGLPMAGQSISLRVPAASSMSGESASIRLRERPLAGRFR